jgi:hypothetical protein
MNLQSVHSQYIFTPHCGKLYSLCILQKMTKRTTKSAKTVRTATPAKLPRNFEDILSLKIEPEEVLYLVKEMARHHDENGKADWYTQVAILADRYPHNPIHVLCIVERMQCLFGLTKDARMKGWAMDTDDPKCNLTNEAVFRAVAIAPMYLRGERFCFDADEFFAITLNETPPEGSA